MMHGPIYIRCNSLPTAKMYVGEYYGREVFLGGIEN